jgi:hypothetical protein
VIANWALALSLLNLSLLISAEIERRWEARRSEHRRLQELQRQQRADHEAHLAVQRKLISPS